MYSDELLLLCDRLFRDLIRFLGNNVDTMTHHELLRVFGDLETNGSLLDKLNNKEAVFARDMAEDLFGNQSIDKGIFCLMLAFSKDPNLGGLDGYIHASMVHKVGSKKNWYGVLQVKDYSADVLEIKKSYRRMVLMLHPDKSRSVAAEGATKLVNAAWDLLSDSRKRASYDRLIGCNQPEKRPKPCSASASSSSRYGQAHDTTFTGFGKKPSSVSSGFYKSPNSNSPTGFGQNQNPSSASSGFHENPASSGSRQNWGDFTSSGVPQNPNPAPSGFGQNRNPNPASSGFHQNPTSSASSGFCQNSSSTSSGLFGFGQNHSYSWRCAFGENPSFTSTSFGFGFGCNPSTGSFSSSFGIGNNPRSSSSFGVGCNPSSASSFGFVSCKSSSASQSFEFRCNPSL